MFTEKEQSVIEVLGTYLAQDAGAKMYILGYMAGKQQEREMRIKENQPPQQKGA